MLFLSHPASKELCLLKFGEIAAGVGRKYIVNGSTAMPTRNEEVEVGKFIANSYLGACYSRCGLKPVVKGHPLAG